MFTLLVSMNFLLSVSNSIPTHLYCIQYAPPFAESTFLTFSALVIELHINNARYRFCRLFALVIAARIAYTSRWFQMCRKGIRFAVLNRPFTNSGRKNKQNLPNKFSNNMRLILTTWLMDQGAANLHCNNIFFKS